MRNTKKLLLAAVVGLATTLTVPAFAQYDRDHDRDRDWGWHQDRDHDRDGDRDDWNRGDNRRAYQNGFKDGAQDRRDGRNWGMRNNKYRDRDDRQAYAAGYRAGFNSSGRGGWGWNGGGYGRNPFNAGQQSGYQDGIRYGSHDRQVGKAYRPTDSQAYEDADHGYTSAYGDKGQFKSGYRQGYREGYQRAYYGR